MVPTPVPRTLSTTFSAACAAARPALRSAPRLLLALLLAVALGLGLQAGAPAARATAVAKPPAAEALPAGIEDLAAYVPANSCSPKARPGTVDLGRLLVATYPGTSFGGSRACGASPDSEHHDGRAVDWMNSVRNATQKKQGKAVVDWLLAPDAQGRPYANARRLGVMYVIWDNHIWAAYRPSDGWRVYNGCTAESKRATSLDAACHRNHMHISLSWAGATAKTSYWTGEVGVTDYGRCRPADMGWAYSYRTPNPKPCARVSAQKVPKGASATLRTLLTYSGRGIVKGDTFGAVTAVQKTIGATQSGTWSSASVSKMRSWQSGHDLAATGKLNYATWRTLQQAAWPR